MPLCFTQRRVADVDSDWFAWRLDGVLLSKGVTLTALKVERE